MNQRLFGVAGWKNSGKTTLVVRLVAELTRRGWQVSTIKHAHHSFDIDHPGADSHRHREAGAKEVAIVSRNRWALMHELRGETEPPLGEILAHIAPCDLVLIEGYKREPHQKIETRRRQCGEQGKLSEEDPAIIAIAADHAVENQFLPVFSLDDTASIATFVEEATGLVEKVS